MKFVFCMFLVIIFLLFSVRAVAKLPVADQHKATVDIPKPTERANAESVNTIEQEKLPKIQKITPESRKKKLIWHDDLDSARLIASFDYRPIFVFFYSPDCPYCGQFQKSTLETREIKEFLEKFILCRIDVTTQEEAIFQYKLLGVPTVVILSADNTQRLHLRGMIDAKELAKSISPMISGSKTIGKDQKAEKIINKLKNNKITEQEWADVMLLIGAKSKIRDKFREFIFQLKPFPRNAIIKMLEEKRLAVRLGAVEILEEVTGDDYGFDPWQNNEVSEKNQQALKKWLAWATNKNDEAVKDVFASLSEEQCEKLLRDLFSDNQNRVFRAKRMLKLNGVRTIKVIQEFLSKNPELEEGYRKRIKEIEYAISLPDFAGKESIVVSHRLLFANLDIKLKTIGELKDVADDAIPVLEELLNDSDPLIREAAIDSLSNAQNKKGVLLILEKHIKKEKDDDVIFSVIRALSRFNVMKSIQLMEPFLFHQREDLVVAALQGLRMMKASKVEKSIGKCLESFHWRVRVAALKTIRRNDLKGLQKPVAKLTKDEDAFVRHNAVLCLARIGDKAETPKLLEELFYKDDSLKGAVLIAYDNLDLPIPAEFATSLQGKNEEVMTSVLQALHKCGNDAVPFAVQLAEFKSDDIACPALNFLAGYIFESDPEEVKPEAFAVVYEVISEIEPKNFPRIKAVMDSISYNLRNLRQLVMGVNRLDHVSGGRFGGKKKVVGFQTVSRNQTIDEIFAAFEFASKKKQASKLAKKGKELKSLNHIERKQLFFSKMEEVFDQVDNENLKTPAALILIHNQHRKALDYLLSIYENQPVEIRTRLLAAIIRSNNKLSDDFMVKMLQDFNRHIRLETSKVILLSEDDKLMGKLFEILESQESQVSVSELFNSPEARNVISSGSDFAKAQKFLREKARQYLTKENTSGKLKNLAIFLIDFTWEPNDLELIKPLTEQSNIWGKRNSLFCLLKRDRHNVKSYLEKAVNDPSEKVRSILPVMGRLFAENNYSDWQYVLHDKESISKLPRNYEDRPILSGKKALLVEYLKKLEDDPSPVVRFEAFFSLMQLYETFSLAKFIRTMKEIPDQGMVRKRVSNFIENSYRDLGPAFAVLVPFIDEEYVYEKRLKAIYKHFKLEYSEDEEMKTASLQTILKKAKDKQLQASFIKHKPEKAQLGVAKEFPVRLIYFTKKGCDECKSVDKMLAEMKQEISSLVVEKHSIEKINAMKLNETYCERFEVPLKIRLVAPAIFFKFRLSYQKGCKI